MGWHRAHRSARQAGRLAALMAPSLLLPAMPVVAQPGTSPGVQETTAIAEEAYIYAFPMLGAYKAMYEFNVDRTSSQYKGPFNQIANEARVFTPRDTSIPTPNSDTPYS